MPAALVDSAIEQHGPYGIMQGDRGDWYLIYFEDDESVESWDELLKANPQFGKSHQLEALSVEVADRELCIERWGRQEPALRVLG